MEWWQAPVVQGLLWGAAVVAAVWVLVPAVVHLIRPGRVHIELLEDPAVPEPRADDATYARAVRAFAEMGFRPAGRLVLRAWFPSPTRWRHASNGQAWMAPDGRILATLMYSPIRRMWVSEAVTLFAGEAYLHTVSVKDGLALLHGDKRRVELDNVEPTELIAEHRRRVEDFARERAVPTKETTLQEAVTLTSANTDLRARADKVVVVMYWVLAAYLLFLYVLLQRLGNQGWMGALRPVAILGTAGWFWIIWRIPAPRRALPPLVGCAIFLALLLPPLLVLDWLPPGGKEASAALDRLDADVVSGRTDEAIDRTVRLGPIACGAVVTRYGDPQTAPDTRRALHTILVRWKGADLGDQASAWVAWCNNGVLGVK